MGKILVNLTHNLDDFLFPKFLSWELGKISFLVNGYISEKYKIYGNDWIDDLNISNWETIQKAYFLACLPLKGYTLGKVQEWLGESENKYWENININEYAISEKFEFIIEKLIEYKRHHKAIGCIKIFIKDNSINIDLCVKALLEARHSIEDKAAVDPYNIVGVIDYVQSSKDLSIDKIHKIELLYINLLDGHYKVRAKFLENQLSNDAQFFFEALKILQKPDDTRNLKSAISTLLNNWQTCPGMQEDDSFCEDDFTQWIKSLKELCKQDDKYWETAQYYIGEVLFYAPQDSNGLWINKTIANELDAKENDIMRRSYQIKILNSRGVYEIDSKAKEELDLAKKYEKQAEDAEMNSFSRLATTMREISNSYKKEADMLLGNNHPLYS